MMTKQKLAQYLKSTQHMLYELRSNFFLIKWWQYSKNARFFQLKTFSLKNEEKNPAHHQTPVLFKFQFHQPSSGS